MRRFAAAALVLVAACSRSATSPPVDLSSLQDLLDRLQLVSGEGVHGPFHKADNALQKDLWTRLRNLAPGPGVDRILLEAAGKVYTRYDENYFHGTLWHWPYLSSRRAIELCDRVLKSASDPELGQRALWLKAFALRCPAMEPWADAERDLETYSEQRQWKPDFDAARATYRTLAAQFPGGRYAAAAGKLADQSDLTLVLPKGPKERDPRDP